MLYSVLKTCCLCFSSIFGVLSWQMLRQGRSLSFLGGLLGLQFLINAVCGTLYANVLFKLLDEYTFDLNKISPHMSLLCNEYFICSTSANVLNLMPNLCIIFCRFIYVRYAHGLVADRGRLLHILVSLSITMFTFHGLSLWLTKPVLEMSSKSNVTHNDSCHKIPVKSDDEQGEDFVKEKLIKSMFGFLYIFILIYIKIVSHKQNLYYGISRVRRNILSLQEHIIWFISTLICLISVDVGLNSCLYKFHQTLVEDDFFLIWWIGQLLRFIFVFNITPFFIVILALKRYPEFLGYRANVFPGQEKPRKTSIEPAWLIPKFRETESEETESQDCQTSIDIHEHSSVVAVDIH